MHIGKAALILGAAGALAAVSLAPAASAQTGVPVARATGKVAARVADAAPGKARPAHHRLPARYRALMRTQGLLDAADQRITALAARDSLAGLAGIVDSPQTGRVTLYWHGVVPERLARLIGRLTRPGVAIRVRAARYTEAQLRRAAAALIRGPAARAMSITQAGPRPDGSGLDVGVAGTTASVARDERRLSAMPAARGIQTYISHARPEQSSRFSDQPWFWGGDAIEDPISGEVNTFGQCSSGFPVAAGGWDYMLTASHCRANGSIPGSNAGDTFFTPKGTRIGSAYAWDSSHDTTIIGPTSAHDGEVYTGSTDPTGLGTGETFAGVAGWKSPQVGDMICISGAYSGEQCFSTIKEIHQTINFGGNVGEVLDETIAEQPSHLAAGGNGDSGGPVYSYDPSSSGLVFAEGIYSGGDGDTTVPCRGVPTSSTRECEWRSYISPINDALAFYAGLSVHTSVTSVPQPRPPLPPFNGGIDDVSGDGHADLLFTQAAQNTRSVQYLPNNSDSNPGGAPFAGHSAVVAVIPAGSLAAAGSLSGQPGADLLIYDTSHDGEVKMIANTGSASDSYQGNGVTVATGLGTNVTKIMAADVNGDGLADLVWVKSDGTAWYLRNVAKDSGAPPLNTDGLPFTGQSAQEIVTSGLPTGPNPPVTMGDLNGDGCADMIYVSGGSLYYLQNNISFNFNGLPFDENSQIINNGGFGAVTQMVAADISGDTIADLLWTDSHGNVYYLPNNFSSNPGHAFFSGGSEQVAVGLPAGFQLI